MRTFWAVGGEALPPLTSATSILGKSNLFKNLSSSVREEPKYQDIRVTYLNFDNLFARLILPDDTEANLKYKSVM